LAITLAYKDVKRYLVGEFARIYQDHWETMATVPSSWPGPHGVAKLVRNSSGYLITPSMIQFINDKNFRPTEQLEVVMGTKKSKDRSHLSPLNELYTRILSRVHDQPALLKVLAVIGDSDFLQMRIGHIEHLLELEPGDVFD
jgi:hypothetical protein